MIEAAGWSHPQVANMLGVNIRTVGRWIDPADSVNIPYSTWNLLLHKANYNIDHADAD